MQMLDLKTKDCILLQLIISHHYNTHLFYIEYDAYFFYVTLCISMTLIRIVYLLYTYSNNVYKTFLCRNLMKTL